MSLGGLDVAHTLLKNCLETFRADFPDVEMVVAAGNSHEDATDTFPASLASVYTVGAVDDQRNHQGAAANAGVEESIGGSGPVFEYGVSWLPQCRSPASHPCVCVCVLLVLLLFADTVDCFFYQPVSPISAAASTSLAPAWVSSPPPPHG